MRSAELAALAGVSVRTLRHYHQTGILAEPPRQSNGYRSYDTHDLIRVLRIRRLADLGIALEQMPGLLDDDAPDASTTLDALDAELAAQIEQLNRRRSLIAVLRAHGAAPDLPPELAPFLAVFASVSLSPKLTTLDRDQIVLLAHFAGERGMPYIERLYRLLSAPAVAPVIAEVTERFGRLGPASDNAEISGVAAAAVDVLRTVWHDLSSGHAELDLGGAQAVFAEFVDETLNEQQRRCLKLIEQALS